MDFKMWYIFASLMLVAVGARRFDQGPQTFFDVSSDSSTAEQNFNQEVIVYLTPEQLRALAEGGAVIRSDENNDNEETESNVPTEPEVTEEQEEEPEQNENEPTQEEQEEESLQEESQLEDDVPQEEQQDQETIQNQDIDFEAILRILNEEGEEEEAVPTLNEPKIEEENTESPRNFSPTNLFSQEPQTQPKPQQGYLAPPVAKKEVLKSYSFIRYQPNKQRQVFNFQLQQQQENVNDAEETNEESQTETSQEKRKFKVIPYEVEEAQEPEQVVEDQAQETEEAEQNQRLKDLIVALKATRFSGSYNQRKNKLQSMFREYKVSSKYLRKLNTGVRPETAAKVRSVLNKQSNKKRLQNKSKLGKGPVRSENQTNQRKSQKSFASVNDRRPIPYPILKNQKQNSRKSIFVPVQTEQRLNTRNVKLNGNRAFIISRKAPVNKNQSPVEVRYLRAD